ncbi:protein containing LysM domain [Vibrio sp. B1REV9]|uniref:LysM peptidoglycan-binding domain-containing protein n=1 Tax=Vibrio sp. B1REV9 TaxID=2751179 RepID=UPI001AFB2CA3|nr:LysM domain-containing protein [Vibrio sp. B1REV9]CAE6885183.1 protein containing LysM domain [Vibrio sp. B1REV9]
MNRILYDASCAVLLILLAFNALASKGSQPLSLKANAPKFYVVSRGDTLWSISSLYLASPWYWPRLWQANPEINNPDLIYPGDTIVLDWVNEQPVLSVKPIKKLSPKIRIIEKQPIVAPLEPLMLSGFQNNRLIDNNALTAAAKVIGNKSGHKYLTADETVYISGAHSAVQWAIFRRLGAYHRQDVSQNVTSLRLIARGTLVESSSAFSGLKITSQQQEILRNDVALPLLNNVSHNSTSTLSPSSVNLSINVLGNLDNTHFSSTNQIVVVDKGAEDGLRLGSVFELKEAARPALKGESPFITESGAFDSQFVFPRIKVGELVVVDLYDYFSFALITKSTRPIDKNVFLAPLSVESSYSNENKK